MHDCKYLIVFFEKNAVIKSCTARYGLCFEQAKSKCGQVTLLRAASMADLKRQHVASKLMLTLYTSVRCLSSKLEEQRGLRPAPTNGYRLVYETTVTIIF